MYCPNCGSEVGEDFNFCPFCEESLNKESSISSTTSFIAPENKVIQSLSEKEIKDKIYDFMMQNQASAFTSRALINRMDKITNDNDELNNSLKAIEGDLYKMVWDGMLNVELRNGEKYYVVNPDFSAKPSEEQILVHSENDNNLENILYNFLKENKGHSFSVKDIFDKLDKKLIASDYKLFSKQAVEDVLNTLAWERKISSDTLLGNKYYMILGESSKAVQAEPFSAKPKKVENDVIIVLVVLSLLGVLFTVIGVMNLFSSFGITFIVLGVILTGIGTKGRCFFIFLACDGCDCDC